MGGEGGFQVREGQDRAAVFLPGVVNGLLGEAAKVGGFNDRGEARDPFGWWAGVGICVGVYVHLEVVSVGGHFRNVRDP
jgi:hypothetical protein